MTPHTTATVGIHPILPVMPTMRWLAAINTMHNYSPNSIINNIKFSPSSLPTPHGLPRTAVSPASTMTSADSCHTNPHTGLPHQLGKGCDRPPRLRTCSFLLPPPHLHTDHFDGTGLDFFRSLTQTSAPYMRFVYLGTGIRLKLPPHDTSQCRSCHQLHS